MFLSPDNTSKWTVDIDDYFLSLSQLTAKRLGFFTKQRKTRQVTWPHLIHVSFAKPIFNPAQNAMHGWHWEPNNASEEGHSRTMLSLNTSCSCLCFWNNVIYMGTSNKREEFCVWTIEYETWDCLFSECSQNAEILIIVLYYLSFICMYFTGWTCAILR